jgi:hypothetical protein
MVSALYAGLALFSVFVAVVLVGSLVAYRLFARDDDGVNRLDSRVDAAFRGGLLVGAPALALGLVGVIWNQYVGNTLATVGFALLVLGTAVVPLTVGGLIANLAVLTHTARQ